MHDICLDLCLTGKFCNIFKLLYIFKDIVDLQHMFDIDLSIPKILLKILE